MINYEERFLLFVKELEIENPKEFIKEKDSVIKGMAKVLKNYAKIGYHISEERNIMNEEKSKGQ